MSYPTEDNQFLGDHVDMMAESYRRLLGEPLCYGDFVHQTVAKTLFYAPFAVLSHTKDVDPLFNYANLKALELFEFAWDELIGMPSRLSVEPACQEDRDKLLEEVSQKGFIKNYQGIRLAKSGSRFLIKNAVVWNLFDRKDNYAGQAACLKEWEFL